MPDEQIANNQSTAILKELGDIKVSLGVSENRQTNIESSITEIKVDIKEIKNDFITRREFMEFQKDIRKEIAPLKSILWKIGYVVGGAILVALLSKVIIK